MAERKPLVQFEISEKAQLVHQSEEPVKKKAVQKRKNTTNRKPPSVVKGKLNIKVDGYFGIQKIPTSALIPYIPIAKLKSASKKVLVASGAKKVNKKKHSK